MLLGYKIAPYNGKRDEGQVILIRKNKSKGMNYETQKRLHRRDVECGGGSNDHCASGNACEVFVEVKISANVLQTAYEDVEKKGMKNV